MSIRARLLWLTLLAILLPALLQTVRHLHERERSIETDTARLAVSALRRTEYIADRVQGTSQLLYGLASASELASPDRTRCSQFLGRVRNEYPQFTGLLTVRPDGRLFCDSLQSGRELDLRDRAYFKAALSEEQGVVFEPVFGRLTGTAVLQIARPVRNADGSLAFILLASLNLEKLLDIKTFPVEGARLVLVDRQGVVMATTRSDAGREKLGSPLGNAALLAFALGPRGSARELPGSDGELAVWAHAQTDLLDATGLRVLVNAPKLELVDAANQRFREDMFALAITAVGLFAAVWLLIETAIRRQIARISQMASQLAAGELSARIAAPLPRGELGELMTQLNLTAASLERQRQDIAELNERLRRSQRLEAVGQLTGGLAHDFNNLLTVVLGNAELLSELNRDRPDQRQLADMIGQAAQRGAALTQRLLAFARKQPLEPRPVDLNQMLAGIDTMLRSSLGASIDVELIRAAGLWAAVVDPGQLENALLNLALNARDAMPDGGKLTLETANVRLDADYASRHAEVTPGQYVMLAVSDTGHGIAREHLGQVFEPFFTTKEAGKGTGLGLSMVYGFVKQSGGHVSLYSEPGQGTTAKLYLPRSLGGVGIAAGPEGAELAHGGSETVLVVEDDAAVRAFAVAQLRLLGYEVIEAADAQAALDALALRSDVDLLFTDIVMPGGMNGRVLADEARRRHPRLRVLYTSGYTENAIVHQGRLDPGAMLLAKPYRRAALDRMVRQALQTAPETAGS